MSERTSMLAAARARITGAKKHREDELPSACCRWCGGTVPAGTGTTEAVSYPAVETRGAKPGPHLDRQHEKAWEARQPPESALWTRACEACADAVRRDAILALALSRLAGRPVARVDADAALSRTRHWERDAEGTPTRLVGLHIFAIEREQATGEPYGHLTADERTRLLDALREAEDAHLPHPSESGACGMCGRAKALRWESTTDAMHSGAFRWPDGTSAMVCGDCHEVWMRRGHPDDEAGVARVTWEAATGQPLGFGSTAPDGVIPFCRSRHADPAGVDEAWSWAAEGLARIEAEREAVAASIREQAERERAERERAEAVRW